MYKTIILSSVLAVLGVGNATAYDAASGFGVSEQNDLPSIHIPMPVDRSAVTSGVTTARQSYGYATGTAVNPKRTAKFSAAQEFGPSEQNDLPAPHFQIAR
jgi:hypothetical protein